MVLDFSGSFRPDGLRWLPRNDAEATHRSLQEGVISLDLYMALSKCPNRKV